MSERVLKAHGFRFFGMSFSWGWDSVGRMLIITMGRPRLGRVSADQPAGDER